MDFNCNVSEYLSRISKATLTLSNMTGCDMKPEAVRKVAIIMLELEQSTADFISELNISDAEAKDCRERFMQANVTAIGHLEKIQLQGWNFSELITALKLEVDTLKEETRLS